MSPCSEGNRPDPFFHKMKLETVRMLPILLPLNPRSCVILLRFWRCTWALACAATLCGVRAAEAPPGAAGVERLHASGLTATTLSKHAPHIRPSLERCVQHERCSCFMQGGAYLSILMP